jgi:hypothetical protein
MAAEPPESQRPRARRLVAALMRSDNDSAAYAAPIEMNTDTTTRPLV